MSEFDKFGEVYTAQLKLAFPSADDIESIFEIRTNDRVNAYLDRPKNPSEEEKIEFLEKINQAKQHNNFLFWTIRPTGKERIIGTICLWNFDHDKKEAEIGYELHPDFHGKGYMSEAINKVIYIGLNEIKLKTIHAFTHRENQPSIDLLERKGFRLNTNIIDEKVATNVTYSLDFVS